MKITAHNMLKGKVKKIGSPEGPICEVLVELNDVEGIRSAISKAKAKEFKLAPGKEVYVIFKSLDVMIAVE